MTNNQINKLTKTSEQTLSADVSMCNVSNHRITLFYYGPFKQQGKFVPY